jgi:hypothetical protein
MTRLSLTAALLLALLPQTVSSASRTFSPADYDGLYYVTAPAVADPYDYRVVLSHDGRAVSGKGNNPDEPTRPGFYRRNARYPFEKVTFSGKRLSFRTASVRDVSYSFDGSLTSRRDSQFDEPIPVFRGTLSELHKGRLHLKRRLTFGHAVQY